MTKSLNEKSSKDAEPQTLSYEQADIARTGIIKKYHSTFNCSHLIEA